MRRGLRAAGVTVGLLLAPAPAALVASPATAQGVAAAPTLRDQLTQDALWREAFARRELWTWTTAEQVAALRTDPRLLSRTESPTRGVSAFDQRVREHMARTSSPISRLLSAPGLARRRFAWTAPWATVLGMPRERYGDRLVRILLRPEAIVGRFLDGTRDAWSFSDLGGRNVPARTVLRDPSRLAAVYHEGPRTSSASGTFVRTETFREIVVVNESMIAQWEVATPAVVERLARDATLVRALASSLGPARDSARELTARWARRPPRPTIEQLYAAAIALPTVLYVERREAGLEDAATALDRALALARAEAPISIAPPRDFVLGPVPSVRPPAPPSRPSPPRGTYIGSFAAPGGGTAAPR